MIEKQEKEDFDDADDDDTSLDGEDVDVARLARDMELSRSRKPRHGTPALRQLELLAEQKRIAELTSDFDDYDLDDTRGTRRVAR
jgi:hypothetical protein